MKTPVLVSVSLEYENVRERRDVAFLLRPGSRTMKAFGGQWEKVEEKWDQKRKKLTLKFQRPEFL